jgi:hypothetical protein
MLYQAGGAEGLAPRQGASRWLFTSLAAAGLLARRGAAAVAPAQAANLGGKVSSNQSEDEFGMRGPAVFDWSASTSAAISSGGDDVGRKGPGQPRDGRHAVAPASPSVRTVGRRRRGLPQRGQSRGLKSGRYRRR